MGSRKDRDLESRLKRLARDYYVPFGISVAASVLLYLGIVKEEHSFDEIFDSIKKAATDPETWRNILIAGSLFVGSLYGALAVRNRIRKRKGKKPMNLLKATKYVLFPWSIPKGEEGFKELLEAFPDSSLLHRGFGDFYFRNGRIIEAMDSYYEAMKLRDEEIFPKLPVLGTNSYASVVYENIRKLEKRFAEDPEDNETLLRLAMHHYLLNDFDNAAKYFEMIDKDQDAIAFHVLASKFYSQIEERVSRPKLRRLSCGSTFFGRLADKAFYFWDKRRLTKEDANKLAERETFAAVEGIFGLQNLDDYLEQVGDYSVYKIGLNGFVRGFVVLKKAECRSKSRKKKEEELDKMVREGQNEMLFMELVATGKEFRSVHPVKVVHYKGDIYLVLLYEEGTPLSESTNTEHFTRAVEFAARSDALMPFDYIRNKQYSPGNHFAQRLYTSGIPKDLRARIEDNCSFLFKYSDHFPVVFDGDWRPDGNCLVNREGHIIALDKEDKGVTIGPVAVARILHQGTQSPIAGNDEFVDYVVQKHYIPVFQDLAGRGKIQSPQLFLPVTLTSAIEKAITAYCFTIDKPSQQASAQVFLRNALHAGDRLRNDRQFREFYDANDIKQCANLEAAIFRNLLL